MIRGLDHWHLGIALVHTGVQHGWHARVFNSTQAKFSFLGTLAIANEILNVFVFGQSTLN